MFNYGRIWFRYFLGKLSSQSMSSPIWPHPGPQHPYADDSQISISSSDLSLGLQTLTADLASPPGCLIDISNLTWFLPPRLLYLNKCHSPSAQLLKPKIWIFFDSFDSFLLPAPYLVQRKSGLLCHQNISETHLLLCICYYYPNSLWYSVFSPTLL